MPITLITGGPGTGKTAWLLDQLINLRKIEPNREFFIHGVRGLTGIQHEQIFCKSQLCDICRAQDEKLTHESKYVENWPEWKQTGSLIIVDEVQRIWRPRAGGAPMPPAVSGLETHRHYGLDFWLISQGPHLFDNAIRLLVGRHVHLVARWSGRSQYEWPECKQDVQSRGDAVVRTYTLPKHVYSMYQSAEVHTVQNKRKPLSFYAAIIAVVLAISLISFIGYRLKNHGVVSSQPVAEGVGGAPPSPSGASSVNQTVSNVALKTADQIQTSYTPLVVGLPWTAPAYQELAKPVVMPVVAGCIKTKDDKRCACYTQQSSIVDMPKATCLLYVEKHAFNPFQQPRQQQQTSETPTLAMNVGSK